MSDHLTPITSDRGFDRLPPIPSEYGGHVTVCESSAASGPHVWLTATAPANLNNPDGPTVDAPMHLTAENAYRLAEQLMLLVRNHYQGDATPEGTDAGLLHTALELIGTDCENYTSGMTCVDSGGRSPYARYGAEQWCARCIARTALAGQSFPARGTSGVEER